jgi:hypothetical protein
MIYEIEESGKTNCPWKENVKKAVCGVSVYCCDADAIKLADMRYAY